MWRKVARGLAGAGLLIFAAAIAAAEPATTPLQEALREQVEQLRDRAPKPVSNAKPATMTLAEAVAAFYEARDFAPAWQDPTRRAALVSELRKLAGDGLDPDDYGVEAIARGPQPTAGSVPDSVVAADEAATTRSFLLALVHLYRGKVDPTTLDPHWNFALHELDPEAGLTQAGAAVRDGDLAALFDQARPPHWLYARLRQAYADLSAVAASGGWPQIADGPTLKAGTDDVRVPVLRQRLQLAGLLAADPARDASTLYDEALAAAVAEYQRSQYLDADGAVGPGTRASLNVSAEARLDQLRVNLERGRWLLHHTLRDFVLVDVAGYRITLFRNNEPVWKSRVQVGKPYRSTPIFESRLTYLTLNPTWTVPPTILREDVLPKIRKDAGYLKRNRMRVFDANGRELAASSVDWSRPGNVTLRQDAGPGNSLGRVVLRFPNPYAVYLHDTPHQELFDASQRAFSSGCIRVERVFELVEQLLDDPVDWNRDAITAVVDTEKTRSVQLKMPVPILIAYWTVDVDANGRPSFKPDVYGRDGPLLAALKERS